MRQSIQVFERPMARGVCRGLRVLAVVMALGATPWMVGCGEATDQPQDCRPGEFFNQANESCEACPALAEPQCRPGFGFTIESDERGCPVAECAEHKLCDSGFYFAADSLSCRDCQTAADPPAICPE